MAISKKLDYSAHFEKARKGIQVNARFSEKIAEIAREKYDIGPLPLNDNEDAEFGVVDSAFGHLSRDWSTQGAKERKAVFPPIFSALEQHFGGNGRRSKVLVPGSGMGRLASDLADLGASILLH
jgi:carnosine N-methyltransferase